MERADIGLEWYNRKIYDAWITSANNLIKYQKDYLWINCSNLFLPFSQFEIRGDSYIGFDVAYKWEHLINYGNAIDK